MVYEGKRDKRTEVFAVTSPQNPAAGVAASDQTYVQEIGVEQAQQAAVTQANNVETAGGGGLNGRTYLAQERFVEQRAAAAIGGGFQLPPSQLQDQLRRSQELRNVYVSALQDAEQARQAVHEPAPDQAGSVLQATQARASLTNLTSVIQSHVAYLTQWSDALATAQQNYLRTEQGIQGQSTSLQRELNA